jgi:RND superfamily putative drug exporter
VMAFVLALTFLVMVLTFRSVVVAVTSIALNLLSAAASYGLLVLVFQGHWAEGLLGFTSMEAIVSWLPLFLFVVLFGLSMDYHVFVVSRVREAVRSGMSTRDAVRFGITTSAGTVTSAAIVMVGVFSIFATLSTIDMKQLGIGLAAAILLDATVIRAVVLPALMTLLGKANWWAPRFLRGREPVTEPAARPAEPDLVSIS